jgi:LPXTG-motif cell wall-anchored protein
VLIRSRSARLAALALAAATPFAFAGPAFATGADLVTAVVIENNVHVTSTKGLSKVTVVYCDGTIVVSDSWSNGQETGDVAIDDVVQAVFVHSGSNTTLEAEALLALLAGPGAVDGKSTGAIALDQQAACDETTVIVVIDDDDDDDTTVIDDTDTGNRDDNGDGENSDPVISIASDPAPVTSVLGVTLEKPADPAPALAPTAVDGSTLEAAVELPRTGSDQVQFLSGLGLALLAAGVALKGATSKRIRSASSPG